MYLSLTIAFLNIVSFPQFVSSTWNTNEYMKRENSLIRPFHGSGSSLNNWELRGSAFASDTFIRLTPDARSMQGGLWNRHPCYSRNWEMEVHFKVFGSGKDLFGDGFAIWYVRDPSTCPGGAHCSVFGSNDYFVGLGVILDTYNNYNGVHNHEHPYISAMVNNGTLHYDHDRDGTHTQVAGCSAKFRGREHDTYVKIKYADDTVTVYTDVENRRAWSQCLTAPGIILPTGYYFGITAATGDLTDTHEIYSVRVYDLDSPDQDPAVNKERANVLPSASFFEAPRDHVDDPKPSMMSGFKKLFLILVGVIVVCGAIFIGGIFYVKQNEHSRKRLY
ncbi:vesicular integral-membrane protein VIP36-like [Amphibalanus amphitrite]|uniref:vesicular integral-membrane protein VIP36-like n=1 Tax=Amphibalanus amphitrite TaxID=1232801 RepID=UPI001C905581|nr:vesicular integral-membrane protein VIP36-like [Amphibalanus amphitrite]